MKTATDGTIIQFLDGSHSYEGVWFGEKHPKRKGQFWWRSILREYFKKQIVDAVNHGYGQGSKRSKTTSDQYYNQTFNDKN